MYTYLVKFAHENENAVSDEERHGAGQIEIETDHTVNTREDLVEIARTIGMKNGYTKVAITDLTQVIDETEDADASDAS